MQAVIYVFAKIHRSHTSRKLLNNGDGSVAGNKHSLSSDNTVKFTVS